MSPFGSDESYLKCDWLLCLENANFAGPRAGGSNRIMKTISGGERHSAPGKESAPAQDMTYFDGGGGRRGSGEGVGEGA